MKKSLKYLFILAAALIAAAGCNDELIPSKDTYGDYKGVTGDFAYITGGTMSEYDAVTAEVQHTTIGELGTVEKTFEVALTKAQSSSVTITVGVDNDAVKPQYDAFPEGVLKYQSTVTIPAGETSAEVKVTINEADFPKLTSPLYMGVFRIIEATGVQISTNSNKATLYVTTETIDPADNMVSIQTSESIFNISNYTDQTRGDSISKTIEVTGTESAFQDFTVSFIVDNSLVAEYNAKNGTEYLAAPDGIVSLGDVTMAKDTKKTSVTVSVADDDRSKFTDAKGYLIPVRIKSVAPASLSENSGVAYLVIKVVNFDYEANLFSSLYLGDYRMSTWYIFENGLDLSGGYTYIFHIFIDEVTDHSRIGDFADANENWINMLRFGQKGNKDTRLEWFVGPNGCRKQLYTPKLDAQKWYQIALVYDTKSYKFYVEGEVVDSYTLTEDELTKMQGLVKPVFQAIEFNSSWGANYRKGNEFHGRFWNFSVWNTDLSASNIKQCYRGMTSRFQNLLNRYGAYWTFDDGYGSVVKQTAGISMGDIDFTKTTRCDDESSMVSADVSEYIQWVADEHNKFD